MKKNGGKGIEILSSLLLWTEYLKTTPKSFYREDLVNCVTYRLCTILESLIVELSLIIT